MNKTDIKNFAVWAREKLISDITYKAGMLGVTENGIAEKLPQSTNDLQFFDIGTKNYAEVSGKEISQRNALVYAIKHKESDGNSFKDAFKYVVEEVAYTWFNRLIAIRFMEVNSYLPSGVRVLSSENRAKNEPDFVTTPFDTDLEFTPYEQDKVIQLKDENKLDELFRMLFIKQCNKLHDILPELFEKTDDYTELLLTISFTDKDGIVYHLVHDIDEDDFNVEKEGQVEIIGWMYQYYNSEPKDTVFANLKKNIKINKENIPAATQLFTPDWIVRYMVENSLGRIWIEGHTNDSLKAAWKYYVDEAEQEQLVYEQIEKTNASYKNLTPEKIKVIDPCMGSGHILVYAFDVLMQIYESYGYTQRDAARSILKNNIYGLDIDKRAYQLAYFAVMMKARYYNRRILTEGIEPNLCYLHNSTALETSALNRLGEAKKTASVMINENRYAEEYGSLMQLSISYSDLVALEEKLIEISNKEDYTNLLDIMEKEQLIATLNPIIHQSKILAQKYEVVVTNPPYAGRRNLNAKMCGYLDNVYPNSKMDLFSAFIERNLDFCINGGFSAYMTPFVWLFLSSYAALRGKLISNCSIDSFLQPEESSFQEAAVSICSFVLRNHIHSANGVYIRQSKFHNPKEQEMRFLAAAKNIVDYKYTVCMDDFIEYPDNRFIYWAGSSLRKVFSNSVELGSVCQPRQGMATTNNELFLRLWYEISLKKIGFGRTDEEDAFLSNYKWFPYNKGGGFRKWYGNYEYCVNYENKGKTICDYIDNTPGARVGSNGRVINRQFFFKKSITWSDICGSSFAARACPNGFIFDVKGSSAFVEERLYQYILAFLNSIVSIALLNTLNPTITTQVGDLKQLPFAYSKEKALEIGTLSDNAVRLSRLDWDSFETSWGFVEHPLVRLSKGLWDATAVGASLQYYYGGHPEVGSPLELCYMLWKGECNERFKQLKANEEELNRIFIDIYGLQDELTAEVEDKDVTVRKADLSRDIKSLISYAVGCMFGRYSLDVDGIAYAGGEFSGQWVVVSGQFYLRKVVEKLVIDELQRVNSMAEIYEFSYGDLSAGEASSERGNICSVRPNETSGSFNSVKYCRGTSTKLYEGIRELSFDSKRVESRAGNTAYDLCSPEILNAISNGNGNELVQRGWKDAEYIDWKAIHYTLTTNYYSPDYDNCIPITDEEYFEDDIVGLFCAWLKKVYGEDSLEQNLDFIAKALGNKGDTSREVIRNYFLNDFMKDHIKTYQKRPIYWLFDSGKQNGFKALCYMHRWNTDTTGNMRVEYLHRMQRVYEKEINRMQEIIDNSRDNKEISNATKRKEKLQKQIKETKDYDAKVAHLALSRIDIDLDDGVKVNYEKVQTASDGKKMQILAKI